jgi:hypothetical protein
MCLKMGRKIKKHKPPQTIPIINPPSRKAETKAVPAPKIFPTMTMGASPDRTAVITDKKTAFFSGRPIIEAPNL